MIHLRLYASGLIAIILVVAALWMWQQGPHWAFDADQPTAALWAARSGAVAAAALGQAFVLLGVIGNLYHARAIDVFARFLAAGVFAVALIGAAALGLVARLSR